MTTTNASMLTNVVKVLDAKTQTDTSVTSDDADDSDKLACLLTDIYKSIADVERRYTPNVITYRDVTTTGTSGTPQTQSFVHKFGGIVDWWVVRVRGLVATTQPSIVESVNDGQVLTLAFYGTATYDIRVQESG